MERCSVAVPVPWRQATQAALYGEQGFFTRAGPGQPGPAGHFRTSVHASVLFARAMLALARSCGLSTVVDVGAGRGELLAQLLALDPTLRLVGVEVAPRPDGLPSSVEWASSVPMGVEALVVANEWLDNVPLDVVEVSGGQARLVLVDPSSGVESLGGPPDRRDLEWLDRWWPLTSASDGRRAEVGWPRDEAWAGVVSPLARGVAVGVDYGHVVGRRPAYGSLTGYRSGRQVPPVPDGSCDVTAHVALDAVAAAGTRAGATESVLTTQRAGLSLLLEPPVRPTYEAARRDPAGALASLSRAGEWAELVDPDGLGGFGWLVQAVGLDLPAAFRSAEPFSRAPKPFGRAPDPFS